MLGRKLACTLTAATAIVSPALAQPRTPTEGEIADHGWVRLPRRTGPVTLDDGIDPRRAPTAAGRRLLTRLDRVIRTLKTTRYQGATRVDERRGVYYWDCSGMMTWLLARTAPTARRSLRSSRPVARDYYQRIASAPLSGGRGWRRLPSVAHARPGDVFAFRRAAISSSRITGHVGILVSRPVEVAGWPGVWVAQIADSTRILHGDDTRAEDGDGGFGMGTMAFATDQVGRVYGYGWHGADSEWIIKTDVVFGRVIR